MVKLLKNKKAKLKVKEFPPQFKKKPPEPPPVAADKVEVKITPVVYYEISVQQTGSPATKGGMSWSAWSRKGMWTEPYTAREMAKHIAEQESKRHEGVVVIDHSSLVTIKPPPMPEYNSAAMEAHNKKLAEDAKAKKPSKTERSAIESGQKLADVMDKLMKKKKKKNKPEFVEAPDLVKARDKLRKQLKIKPPKKKKKKRD